MSAADLWDISYTVADRFKMQPSELDGLKITDLKRWYEGAVKLYKMDAGQ